LDLVRARRDQIHQQGLRVLKVRRLDDERRLTLITEKPALRAIAPRAFQPQLRALHRPVSDPVLT
jgi:hypothetical protein